MSNWCCFVAFIRNISPFPINASKNCVIIISETCLCSLKFCFRGEMKLSWFLTCCILIVSQRFHSSNSNSKEYKQAGFHGSRTRKPWHHTYILHLYYISIADLLVFVMWSFNSRIPLHASVLKLSDHTLMYNYGMFHVWYGLTLLGSCLTWIPSHCTLCGDTISQSYVITTMVPSKPALVRLYLKPHPMVTQKLLHNNATFDTNYQLWFVVPVFFLFSQSYNLFQTFLAFSFLKRWWSFSINHFKSHKIGINQQSKTSLDNWSTWWKPNKEVRKYRRL